MKKRKIHRVGDYKRIYDDTHFFNFDRKLFLTVDINIIFNE